MVLAKNSEFGKKKKKKKNWSLARFKENGPKKRPGAEINKIKDWTRKG